MRIEALGTLVAVVWLTAVLCPRHVAGDNLTISSFPPSRRSSRGPTSSGRWPSEGYDTFGKRMTYREMQMVLREEGGEDGLAVDCCPTIEEMVEPVGGRNRLDMYVELYRDGENVQRFFEYSCRPDVLERPCRFVDRKLTNRSRCVQKFSYTYAIVDNSGASSSPTAKSVPAGPADAASGTEEDEHRRRRHREHRFPTAFSGNAVAGSGWTLDYIRVRSGCSCEISPAPKKRKTSKTSKTSKTKRPRSKLRNRPRDQETGRSP